MFKPQHLLVEERGLGNQIKKIEDLIPSRKDADKNDITFTATYLREQLTNVVLNLEDIKAGIKHENDRILKYGI
tara:strand:- start:2 stop:223 length:222 start_codon:yes stop_codon:yes gene_type:complete